VFPFTPNRKVVVPSLPETRRAQFQLAGGDLFHHLNHYSESVAFGFADEQVYVLRHHHITRDVAAIPAADSLEFSLEGLSRCDRIKERHPMITTERDEMQAALVLVAFGLGPHCKGIVVLNDVPPSRKNREKGGATPKWEFNLKGWASPPGKQ
jgi:hypothetical protein